MANIEMIKYHGQIDSKNVVVKCERVCYRVGRMLGSKDKGWMKYCKIIVQLHMHNMFDCKGQ